MAYTLQALIANQSTLEKALLDLPVVKLSQGLIIVPFSEKLCKEFGLPLLPLIYEASSKLPASIATLCSTLSRSGRIAYVEAEFFGGMGDQAHALFDAGVAVGPIVVSDSAINQALQFLGVRAEDDKDEFDSVSLGQHRKTEQWLGYENETSQSPVPDHTSHAIK